MTLPVTAFVGAICALLLLFTAMLTVRQRLRLKAAFGDQGDAKLIAASRSHGNLAEHAPIVVILLGLLETARANHMALMVIGALFLIGRVAHIAGLHAPVEPGKPPVTRQVGVAATWITLLALGGWTRWMLATVILKWSYRVALGGGELPFPPSRRERDTRLGCVAT